MALKGMGWENQKREADITGQTVIRQMAKNNEILMIN
jgi:hypothetical protein